MCVVSLSKPDCSAIVSNSSCLLFTPPPNSLLHRFQLLNQRRSYMRGHKGRNVAAEPGDFLDDARTEERVSVLRHHENRFHVLVQFAVHQRELEFKFEIRDGAQAADDGLRFALLDVMNEQGIEGI